MKISAVKLYENGFMTQPFAFEDLPGDWKCPRCRQGKKKLNRA